MKSRDNELLKIFGLLPEFHLSQEFTAMVTQLDDIELPLDSTITSQIEPTNPTIEAESPMNTQLLESDIMNDPRECTVTEKVRPLKTPPTVKRVIDENKIAFIDDAMVPTTEFCRQIFLRPKSKIKVAS